MVRDQLEDSGPESFAAEAARIWPKAEATPAEAARLPELPTPLVPLSDSLHPGRAARVRSSEPPAPTG